MRVLKVPLPLLLTIAAVVLVGGLFIYIEIELEHRKRVAIQLRNMGVFVMGNVEYVNFSAERLNRPIDPKVERGSVKTHLITGKLRQIEN